MNNPTHKESLIDKDLMSDLHGFLPEKTPLSAYLQIKPYCYINYLRGHEIMRDSIYFEINKGLRVLEWKFFLLEYSYLKESSERNKVSKNIRNCLARIVDGHYG